MIRFRCPNCDREYVLPDALAHLPLLCKKCGHRLDVPEPQPEPPPVEAVPLPMKPMPVAPEIIPPSPAPDEMDELLSSDSLAGLELPQEKPTLVSKNADNPVAPTPVMAPVAGTGTERDGANRSRRYLSGFADGIVVLILLGVGMLVGEMVARKPSGMILREAASAPKFPPIDLLL